MMETIIWAAVAVLAIAAAFIRLKPTSLKEFEALRAEIKELKEVIEKVRPYVEPDKASGLAPLPSMQKLLQQVVKEVNILKPQKALFDNWDVLVGQFESLKNDVAKVNLRQLGQKLTGSGT